MIFKLRIRGFSVVFSLILLLGACNKVKKAKEIKLAHGLNVDHPVHKAMEFMAERIDEKSGGELKIKVYPSQQLGTERECLELLQIGSLGMTKVSAAVLENFTPSIRVFSLPYLFRNDEHYLKVLRGEIGRELLLQSQEFWLRGLTYYDSGKRSFYTKDRPIRKPGDLQGLKIRVQESVMAIELIQTLGGSPTPISWGELYTALQQGVVDGAENNSPSFFSSRHYEVCNFYSIDQHTAIPDLLLISTIWWNKLSSQEQQWLQEAADESSVYQFKIWKEAEKEAMKAVKEAGVEIIYPEKEPFIEKVESLYQSYKNQDPELYELARRIQEVD